MAERRMFTKKVTEDDHFMELSSSAQALYLHLSMSADDDGFCSQINVAMFRAHASVQDLEALLEKRFIYQFENGVIVIKHWRMANALRKDRYNPTAFQEELAKLQLKPNGSYTFKDQGQLTTSEDEDAWLPDGCQVVASGLPQVSIGKVILDNNSLDNNNPPISPLTGESERKEVKPKKRFTPPTIEEIAEYCDSRNNGIDPEEFWHFYNSKNWMIGKDKMTSWKSAVITWEKNAKKKAQPKRNGSSISQFATADEYWDSL